MSDQERAAPASSIRKVGRRRAVSTPAVPVTPIIDPTHDDRDQGPAPDPSTLDERERWMLAQRPPHWG